MLQNVGGEITRMMAVHMMSTFKAATFHQITAGEIWARDVVTEKAPVLNGTVRVPVEPFGAGRNDRSRRDRRVGGVPAANPGGLDHAEQVWEREHNVHAGRAFGEDWLLRYQVAAPARASRRLAADGVQGGFVRKGH